jgi:nitrite reductase (NADH) small subunit
MDVCALDELIPGVVRVVELADQPNVGLLRLADEVRAFGLMCPHRGGPLERGRVRSGLTSEAPGEMTLEPEHCVLTCPWHNWEFSLEDGRALFDTKRKLRMYPTEVDGGRVRLRLDA